MATNADRYLDESIIVGKTVKAASTVTKGYPVKLNTSDSSQVLDCGAGEACDGVALDSGAAGEDVRIVMAAGGGIVPMKVGTAGVTAGDWVKMTSDGIATATPGGGTTVLHLIGKATQTGTVGHMVGVQLMPHVTVSS